MADPQAEPFVIALSALRDRLHAGALPPGARLTAVDLADELGLSTTPVREALSRLAGEDLVEDRRGQGYFVRRLNAADIADLYRMSLALLLIALDPRRPVRPPPTSAASNSTGEADPVTDLADPIAEIEGLFRGWVGARGSRILIRDFRILQNQLGPVRRLEPAVLGDVATEAAILRGSEVLPRPERLTVLRQFHASRIRGADALAAALEARALGPKK